MTSAHPILEKFLSNVNDPSPGPAIFGKLSLSCFTGSSNGYVFPVIGEKPEELHYRPKELVKSLLNTFPNPYWSLLPLYPLSNTRLL